MLTKEEISNWFKFLQDSICEQLEKADGGAKFKEEIWDFKEGGGGRTRIIQDGNVIEKGGVNFSGVYGKTPDFLKQESQHSISSSSGDMFFATGVSIVIHPISPMVPIIHMNVRYFEMNNGVCWFGGGIDLTPHYVDKEDAKYFHRKMKEVCDKHNANYYSEFKKWADDYFYIKHRNETRGIGGVFFDRLSATPEISIKNRFEFVKEVGSLFASVYTYFMNKNKNIPYGENEKQWQLIRRGRYVEFNLVYDKGTKFGLETNGRTESILMSLPKNASWFYDYKTVKGSREEQTLGLLTKGVDWIGVG